MNSQMINAKRVLTFVLALASATVVAQISVPAVVVDPSGQSVHGLQKSDFDVRCGKLASFDSVEEVPPLKFSNFADPVPVFILFDAISIHPPEQGEISRLLLEYLRTAADEHLAVTLLVNTASGIVVIHDMSTDPRVFSAAMDRILPKAGGPRLNPSSTNPPDDFTKEVNDEVVQLQQLTRGMPPLGQYEGFFALQRHQLESLRIVGRMLEHSRKRKPLIWISDWFPIYVENGSLILRSGSFALAGSMEYDGHQAQSAGVLTSAYQGAIDSLNEARVSIYPMSIGPGHYGTAYDDNTKLGLKELATRTGGSLSTVSHDLDFASVITDLRRQFDSYYILTFTVQPARKRSWIDSSVKVTKPGAKITAANGFFSSHD